MSDAMCIMGDWCNISILLKKNTCQKTNEFKSLGLARVKTTLIKNPMETLQCKCLRVKKYGC